MVRRSVRADAPRLGGAQRPDALREAAAAGGGPVDRRALRPGLRRCELQRRRSDGAVRGRDPRLPRRLELAPARRGARTAGDNAAQRRPAGPSLAGGERPGAARAAPHVRLAGPPDHRNRGLRLRLDAAPGAYRPARPRGGPCRARRRDAAVPGVGRPSGGRLLRHRPLLLPEPRRERDRGLDCRGRRRRSDRGADDGNGRRAAHPDDARRLRRDAGVHLHAAHPALRGGGPDRAAGAASARRGPGRHAGRVLRPGRLAFAGAGRTGRRHRLLHHRDSRLLADGRGLDPDRGGCLPRRGTGGGNRIRDHSRVARGRIRHCRRVRGGTGLERAVRWRRGVAGAGGPRRAPLRRRAGRLGSRAGLSARPLHVSVGCGRGSRRVAAGGARTRRPGSRPGHARRWRSASWLTTTVSIRTSD